MDPDVAITRAQALVDEVEAAVVLTGAGISTDSGIPDFRGPNGVWTKNPEAERTATISAYMSDPDLRRRNWERLAEGSLWAGKRPNAGHEAIVQLERRERLHTLITQNVDGLHQMAGTSPERIVEIHGTTTRVRCLSCDEEAAMEAALQRVRAGESDPACRTCGGILKSATISFGQQLVARDLERAERAALEAEVLIAVGTSLQVYPIAAVVPLAIRHGARLVIVNAEPTPFDDVADAVVQAGISEALPQIVAS